MIKEANESFKALYDAVVAQRDKLKELLRAKGQGKKDDIFELRAQTAETYQAFEPVLNLTFTFQENVDTFMTELSKCLGEDWTKWAREQLKAIANSEHNTIEKLTKREKAFREAILPIWTEKKDTLHGRLMEVYQQAEEEAKAEAAEVESSDKKEEVQ